MAINIKDCGGQAAAIRAAANAACANAAGTITDADLRRSIQNRCRNLTVECENNCSGTKLGYTYRFTFFWLFTIYKFKTVHLCLNHIRRASIADIILHEVAHTCCWDHGDGKGVPGNNGRLPN